MKRRVKALTVVLAICLITVFIRCQSNETPIQQLVVALNGDSIEMVFVKGGTFMMGCTDEQGCDCEDNEKPVRKESVSDFYIGKYYMFNIFPHTSYPDFSHLPFYLSVSYVSPDSFTSTFVTYVCVHIYVCI